MPAAEPGTIKAIFETLLKPFSLILNPIAERIGHAFERKPRLHIHVRPRSTVWCYAWEGRSTKPIMQLNFAADITNDGHDGVLILDGYLKGTKPELPFPIRIEVPARATIPSAQINLMVRPVIGKGGKDYTAKVILIDQLKRKHRTDKITFTWIGTTDPPKSQTPTNALRCHSGFEPRTGPLPGPQNGVRTIEIDSRSHNFSVVKVSLSGRRPVVS